MSIHRSCFSWKQTEKLSFPSACQVRFLKINLVEYVLLAFQDTSVFQMACVNYALRGLMSRLHQLKVTKSLEPMFADITDKLNHRKQKVKALHEATGWYKRLLSLRCEYSDGMYRFLSRMSASGFGTFFECSVCLCKLASHATEWVKNEPIVSVLPFTEVRLGSVTAVKFIFTNVDPRDPDRVFSFSIRLDKSTSSWTSKWFFHTAV